MAGRPPLRIGSHGKISRKHLGDAVWLARCRYRDGDGVTRIVERRGPVGDQYGKLAEDALIEALGARRTPAVGGEVTLDTKLTVLVVRHIDRLEEDGRIATGQSADTDTVVASVKAYVNALNRLIVRRTKSAPDSDVKSVNYRDAS